LRPWLVGCLRGDWLVLRDVGAFLGRPSEAPHNTERVSPVALQLAKQPLPTLAPEAVGGFSKCMLGIFISSLSLMFAHSAASAQSASPGSATSPLQSQVPKAGAGPEAAKPSARYRDLSAAYFADCMKDWDAATHMTRQQWARTCRRVVEGRVQFMLQHE